MPFPSLLQGVIIRGGDREERGGFIQVTTKGESGGKSFIFTVSSEVPLKREAQLVQYAIESLDKVSNNNLEEIL